MLLATLPSAGVAYLIRLYFGRTHWAVAVLYGLIAFVFTLAFLAAYSGAETPLNMSVVASTIGACILALPGKSIPGVEEESESSIEDEGVGGDLATNAGEDTNDSQGVDHSDSTDRDTVPLSGLPELKSNLEETRELLDRLRRQKDETSTERYERLRQQYEDEIEKLESEIGRLSERGRSRKDKLESRLSHQRSRVEEIENELEEIDSLYEEGAIRESRYQEERSQLKKERENAAETSSQIEDEIDEVDSFLSEIEEVDHPKDQTRGATRREKGQGHQAQETQNKRTDEEKQEVFESWQLAIIAAILLPAIGYWVQEASGPSQPRKEATSETSASPESPTSETPTSKSTGLETTTPEQAMLGGGSARTGVYSGPVPELNADETEGWKFRVDSLQSVDSPPMGAGDNVYFVTTGQLGRADSSYLYAVNAETGQKEWRFGVDRTGLSPLTAPAVMKETVLIGDNAGHIHAVSAKTGKERWQFNTGENVTTSPAVVDSTAYVGNAGGDMYALNIGSGQQQWRFRTYTSGLMSDPAVANGTVYFGAFGDQDRPGEIYALNAKTGRELWKFRVDSRVSSSLSVGENRLYLACSSGMVNIGYYDHENYVYALNTETGQVKWRFEANGRPFGNPSVARGNVYVASSNSPSGPGYVHSIDSKTGQEQWRFEASGDIDLYNNGVLLSAKTILFKDESRLYSLDINSGEKNGHSNNTFKRISASKESFYFANDKYVYRLKE